MRVHSTRVYVLGYSMQLGKIICLEVHPAHINQTTLLSMHAMNVDGYVEMEASA